MIHTGGRDSFSPRQARMNGAALETLTGSASSLAPDMFAGDLPVQESSMDE
jgi:hypothetical protein